MINIYVGIVLILTVLVLGYKFLDCVKAISPPFTKQEKAE